MPRVAIKKKDYKVSDLSKWLVGKMYEQKLRQTDVAEMIGISQPQFSQKLKKGIFSYSDLLTLLNKLNATDEEILIIMKM